MTNPSDPPTVTLPPIQNPDIPNLDANNGPEHIQVSYSVKRPRDTYEAGPITNLTDASTFARILSELTVDIWNVLETKTTITSVAAYSPPSA